VPKSKRGPSPALGAFDVQTISRVEHRPDRLVANDKIVERARGLGGRAGMLHQRDRPGVLQFPVEQSIRTAWIPGDVLWGARLLAQTPT